MSKQAKKSIAALAAFLILILVCVLALAPAGKKVDPPDQQQKIESKIEKSVGGIEQDGGWHFGYEPAPKDSAAFVASLAKPTLAQAGPEVLLKAQDRKPVFLYRALYSAFAAHEGGRAWVVGKQGIGDCVSWGWAHAADIHLAVMWVQGDSAEWRAAATEAIYGGSRVEARGVDRGGYSDGSYGAAAAKWVRDWGVVFRQPYGEIDLTRYSASRAKEWGNYGCGGKDDKGKLDEIAKEHGIRNVVLIKNFRDAAAAIQSGYPIPVCSGQGFSSTRDEKGFARASGHWAHCMCFVGVRFDPPGLLCLNSWGPKWISGPKFPDDMPDGSFWVTEATVDRMLSGNDSFAVSGYNGFPYRDLTHGDWVLTDPSAVRDYVHRITKPRRDRFARADQGDQSSFLISP
jgi:hypothetical protein